MTHYPRTVSSPNMRLPEQLRYFTYLFLYCKMTSQPFLLSNLTTFTAYDIIKHTLSLYNPYHFIYERLPTLRALQHPHGHRSDTSAFCNKVKVDGSATKKKRPAMKEELHHAQQPTRRTMSPTLPLGYYFLFFVILLTVAWCNIYSKEGNARHTTRRKVEINVQVSSNTESSLEARWKMGCIEYLEDVTNFL